MAELIMSAAQIAADPGRWLSVTNCDTEGSRSAMGDRANVVVLDDKDGQMIYFYAHWGGESVCADVKAGLRECGPDQPHYGNRWDDSGRVASAIFRRMAGDDPHTPYAQIALYRRDNEYPIVVVDSRTQTVGLAHEGKEPECYRSWSFADFIELPLPDDGWPEGERSGDD